MISVGSLLMVLVAKFWARNKIPTLKLKLLRLVSFQISPIANTSVARTTKMQLATVFIMEKKKLRRIGSAPILSITPLTVCIFVHLLEMSVVPIVLSISTRNYKMVLFI